MSEIKINKEEFKKAVKPAIEWLQSNCSPHERIIIEMDNAELVGGEIAVKFDVLD